MKRVVWGLGALLMAFALIGCSKSTDAGSTDEQTQVGANETGAGEPGVNGNGGAAGSSNPNAGGVTPMAGVGAGGMAPVSGSESLQGSGSGVGQAAKDKAKSVAGSAPSSLNQAPTSDDGN